MKEFWEERFAQEEYIYGTEPNDFIREQLDKMNPGTGLFPAEGEGRNAVYAATKGWDVQCFDYSENAKDKALVLASDKDVKINYDIADLAHLQLPSEVYDAAFVSFLHVVPEIRPQIHQLILDSLKPGGKLVMEVYHKKQLPYRTGGPGHPDMLYTRQTLENDFSKAEISFYDEGEREIKEGSHHHGKSYTIRIILTKQ